MKKQLTKKQEEILEFIKKRIKEKGYPPAVREICEATGLKSTSTVHGHLTRLEKKGYIRRDPSKPRAIEIVDDEFYVHRNVVQLPLVGKVTAGEPILAVENIEETMTLPYDLVGTEDAFLLRVRGDSMIEAGIFDNDIIIVRRQNVAENGDIVVALIDDEATVKRFYKEHDHIRLQPENKAMEPIIVKDVKILGKVIGLIRRM
ncbi:transcriptional repressor, LexA family [Caldicellulosiruptor acetigenus I77R1B]|jgi:repressor LexA|uniref:LexA repressor n=4 Tax=Caldicellulosiruptor TaxID=44000 RepID=E4Q9J0_CALH1|nr:MULTISPECIES: transcriptional repressor LexA [Caldicellulosiruptor]ADQ06961.1 transcriptional repressor, LexA family [Caldicellulosiruptor hydrothermalis 108]ADQ40982.1 transcriptional repressor, LexA family [Caldicellulosiruptor acetigenus I77R1B]AEM73520.1 SOS-response transcriptional repressor, LexA [Caldicellulosiruptor acetigenus 6A]WAM37395.1 transcriptional repressor LexA [Caldicellulosiruptor acetigenus]BCS81063.1 LexA repressor [Caldicellulosiruptor diazotrophicus]